MNFESKFSIGDKVFYPKINRVVKQIPCPDCLGEKVWTVTSPAGSTYQFACPRCSDGYNKFSNGELEYPEYEMEIQQLTIGKIYYEATKYGNRLRYMCEETGVGSGTLYDEDDLSLDRDYAEKQGKINCKIKNDKDPIVTGGIERIKTIRDYQLRNLIEDEENEYG